MYIFSTFHACVMLPSQATFGRLEKIANTHLQNELVRKRRQRKRKGGTNTICQKSPIRGHGGKGYGGIIGVAEL